MDEFQFSLFDSSASAPVATAAAAPMAVVSEHEPAVAESKAAGIRLPQLSRKSVWKDRDMPGHRRIREALAEAGISHLTYSLAFVPAVLRTPESQTILVDGVPVYGRIADLEHASGRPLFIYGFQQE